MKKNIAIPFKYDIVSDMAKIKLDDVANGRVGMNLSSELKSNLTYSKDILRSDSRSNTHNMERMKHEINVSRSNWRLGIPEDEIFVAQMSDLGRDFLNATTFKIKRSILPRRVVTVEPDDIIFRSRGMNTTAVIATKNLGPAILVSPLYLIRVKDRKTVLPEYLCWYINQIPAQHFFHQMSAGTALHTVSIQQMMNLPIMLPPLSTQEEILELHILWIQERSLSEQMIRMKDEHLRASLLEASKIFSRSKASPTQ